ncbi:MAG: MmgE/PrpD family protein [Desulfotignum sp.]|nr:MmgE/PrpD family protein [Desulfotignum sp.]
MAGFYPAVSSILAGSSSEGIKELKEVIGFFGGSRQATIFSFDEKTTAPSAAFLNSVMCHARDFDDTHDGALNHGCVTIVPALLATCQSISSEEGQVATGLIPRRKISGTEFIAALSVGLDVSNRLGMAFIKYLHVGWLPTTLWGPFACAAACGRLLQLDETKMHNAFGLAYSQIHANRQGLVDGVLSKRIQPGFSASAGVQAAFFAANGITGAKNIIDGNFGLPALYTAGKIDRSYLTKNLGQSFETSNISIKPYPSCRCTHPVIDSVTTLKKKYNIEWQAIESGIIYLPPQSMGQIGNIFQIRENPTVDAQFSAQYTAALTFINGTPRLQDFEKISVASRQEITKLASRFQVVEYQKNEPGMIPVEINIRLKNGKSLTVRTKDIKGSANNPLSREELTNKFNDCVDHSIKTYSMESRKKMIDQIADILNIEDMLKLICLI